MTSNHHDEIIPALRQLNAAITVSNRAVLADLGLKDNELAVLNALDQTGPLTPSELAQITHTHLATMTGVLTRLETNGWISKEYSSTDRRSLTVRAIGSGRLAQHFEPINHNILSTFTMFNQKEQEAIVRFVDEISTMIQQGVTGQEN